MTKETLIEKWLSDWVKPLAVPKAKNSTDHRRNKELIQEMQEKREKAFISFLSNLSERELKKPYIIKEKERKEGTRLSRMYGVPQSTVYDWVRKGDGREKENP